MTASLLTHVIFQPGDGIRRTGKARVNMRIPRVAVAPKFLAQPGHITGVSAEPIRDVTLASGRRTPSLLAD